MDCRVLGSDKGRKNIMPDKAGRHASKMLTMRQVSERLKLAMARLTRRLLMDVPGDLTREAAASLQTCPRVISVPHTG